MSAGTVRTWRGIRAEVLRRIETREWSPGETIPKEVDLAEEFRCARATVNRALQSLSDDGLLERRRKAGTRVAPLPVRRAMLDIPVLRLEIEGLGKAYGYKLLRQAEDAATPKDVQALLAENAPARLLRLEALHLADGAPYAYEERWINLTTVPEAEAADFALQNANEWLVNHVPYSECDVALSAMSASQGLAEKLQTTPGAAVFRLDRNTRQNGALVTAVRQVFAPGYALRAALS